MPRYAPSHILFHMNRHAGRSGSTNRSGVARIHGECYGLCIFAADRHIQHTRTGCASGSLRIKFISCSNTKFLDMIEVGFRRISSKFRDGARYSWVIHLWKTLSIDILSVSASEIVTIIWT
ncbi:hypothetical protein MPTK1_7g01420 [Marchantia polymorpha subsp. ruderalis]|uniref:Uncharacterized protein n=2 Tax=Marchantia polymorpha TaxID=3197 RepID=A0AAF6BV15_MARPO|nr:hypothetical protein MARPO_0099s0016 [Marchantia polymorpha]BBN15849.1 hypothetical protein Mp_7g01420 [Marchantia polymorpha subsp. ruderalis]|eukprot:PTQ32377.1 hypothetical protein MARPO_0099s0016 [Marchantia polymorpha]